jgi:hypothetical protein
VFHPGTPLDEIADYIRSIVPALRAARALHWKEPA